MWLIRATQKERLAQASFDLWLVNHAQRFFAAQCQQLGPEGTRSFIAEAVGRARQHGLAEGPDICRYLDLAFTFGSDFDHALPWAQAILGAAGGRASVITVDRLHDAAMALLDPTSARAAEAALQDEGPEAADDDADTGVAGSAPMASSDADGFGSRGPA